MKQLGLPSYILDLSYNIPYMGLFLNNQIYLNWLMVILLLFNINIYAACPTINADGTCKKSSSSKSTTTCNTGYYLDSKNKCVPCPTGCTACTSDTVCTECQPKYALVTNREGLCMACPQECTDTCSITPGPYYTYDYMCLVSPPASPTTPPETVCPAGASTNPGGVAAASWVCSCRCTNLNANSACPSRDTYEAAANPTTTDSNECVNKCGPYGQKISQFPYLKSGKENCYCDSGLLWNGTSCGIDKTCPSGSVWCSDGSLNGCFTCPIFPTSISLCTGSKGTIAVQKCERPATANSICYGRTVANGQSTGGWDSQTGLEEDCQCIDVYSASVNPCKK